MSVPKPRLQVRGLRGRKATVAAVGLVFGACGGAEDASEASSSASREGGAISIVQLAADPASPIQSGEPLLGECRLTVARTLGGTDDFGYVDAILSLEDGLLLVVDLLSPPFLKILDRASGRVVDGFGPRGEGPKEFQGPTSVYLSPRDPGTVEVYDYSNQRISFVQVGRATPPVFVRELPFRIQVGLMGLEPYGDRYVGVGRFADYTLLVVDEAGRSVERLVTDPPFNAEATGGYASFAGGMNDSRLAGGGSSRVVVGYRSASVLDLVDLDARTYLRVVAPRPTETHFEIRDGRLFVDEENELAYLDVAATERLVFGVFDGLTRAKRREAGPGGGTSRTIHVFDWEGRYLLEIELDRGITTLAVSPDHRRMWTGFADPYPLVGEWEIPPIDELIDRLDNGADAAELELCRPD